MVIFVKSVARARELNRLLNECNFPSTTIHSSMTQEARLKVGVGVYVLGHIFVVGVCVCVYSWIWHTIIETCGQAPLHHHPQQHGPAGAAQGGCEGVCHVLGGRVGNGIYQACT